MPCIIMYEVKKGKTVRYNAGRVMVIIMRAFVLKRTAALFLSVLLLLGSLLCFAPQNVNAAETREEKYVSHLINVVYDDSNSMLMDNRLWWCYAKYSLEVFSAMMQDKDSMNIYYMSNGNSAPKLSNLSGDKSRQQKNIDTIHNTVTNTSGTPFSSIEKAYGDLKQAGGYDEKWIVVITDGEEFNNRENSNDLDRLFSDCSDNNIKVVYLAIGNALVPTEKQSEGIYVYKADGQDSSGETGILSRVTQICQRIFERPVLPSKASSKLTLDIPASEIIVFAQGANVSIGNIDGTNRTLSSVAMNSSDKDKATSNALYAGSINIDTLNASIATFIPKNGEYINEGSYDLQISADEYVIYYKPCLDVVLELIDGNGKKMTDKYIPIGSYSLRYWLTYPHGHSGYGEKLAQDLFDVDYTLTCEVDGVSRPLTSDNVDLKEGQTTISVLAEYLNFSSSDAALKYVVEDFTINELEISLEYLQREYRLSTLEKDNEGILVKVTQNGSPISKSEWERFTAECVIDNPDFKIEKNSDSTFTVYPQYNDGKREGTATGDIVFDITVSASNDHRITDSGTVKAQINIFDDVSAAALGVSIAGQNGEYFNKDFDSQNADREVTIDWAGHYLTKEQYDALVLSVDIDDEDFTADIELNPYVEGEPTTATVRFGLKSDENGEYPAPKDLHGQKNFTVNAVIEIDGRSSTGMGSGVLIIDDSRTCYEKIHDWMPIIITVSVLLFLFLGYAPIIKKYLPWHSTYVYGNTICVKKTIDWYKPLRAKLSACIPFMKVRSIGLTEGTTPTITLEVKATKGKSRAVLLNAKDICDNNEVNINGRKREAECKVNLHNMKINFHIGEAEVFHLDN